MIQRVTDIFEESVKVKQETLNLNGPRIVEAVQMMLAVFRSGGKILFCGNGGSAADSQHIAAEFIGRFQKERRSLPAIALTTDSSILTALGNDYGYDVVFARQVEGLGRPGDLLVGISTSGNSRNVIEAVKKAQTMGIKTISLTGGTGGELAQLTDINLNVPSKVTARIQESHLCMEHVICDLVEEVLSRE